MRQYLHFCTRKAGKLSTWRFTGTEVQILTPLITMGDGLRDAQLTLLALLVQKAHFTCFAGTKVQILTRRKAVAAVGRCPCFEWEGVCKRCNTDMAMMVCLCVCVCMCVCVCVCNDCIYRSLSAREVGNLSSLPSFFSLFFPQI